MLKEIKILIDELYLAGDSPDVTADTYVDIAMPKVARIKELLDSIPDDTELALTTEETHALAEAFALDSRKASQQHQGFLGLIDRECAVLLLEQNKSAREQADGTHDGSRSVLGVEEPKSGETSRGAKGPEDDAL